MNARVAARSDVGRVREGNEDSYVARQPVFAVADGMGGHIAGDIASQTAVQTIERETGGGGPLDPDRLVAIVQRANAAIWERAKGDPALRGMGTTCTLAFLSDDGAVHLAHVGDSRAYLFRDGELSQITEDHTLVGRMVREGRLTAEEAERHPQRSIITRALGVDEHVEVDTVTLTVKDGDRILLCSDGLTSMIDTGDISEVLTSERDAQPAADRLVDLANSAGGEDNITVVLVDITADGATRTSEEARDSAPAPPAARVDTQPAPPDAPPAVTTGVHRLEDLGTARPRRRRWWKLIVALIVIGALVGGGYLAARWALDNSWYVGTSDDGTVTIYRGIPEEILGISLREEERVTNLDAGDLPGFLREDVEAGIKVGSLSEAESTVDDLTGRARDKEFEDEQQKDGNGGGGG